MHITKAALTQTFYTAEYSKFTLNSNFTLATDTWRVMAVKDKATKYEKASFAAAYHFIVYEKKDLANKYTPHLYGQLIGIGHAVHLILIN